MRKIVYYTVLYSVFVVLGGIMSFFHGKNISSFFFEILGGSVLLGSVYFITKRNKYIYFVNIFIAIVLIIFYGYHFSSQKNFYAGLMALITAFFIGSYLLDMLFSNYQGKK